MFLHIGTLRSRQERALERRTADVKKYSGRPNYQTKLNIATNEVEILKKKLGKA